MSVRVLCWRHERELFARPVCQSGPLVSLSPPPDSPDTRHGFRIGYSHRSVTPVRTLLFGNLQSTYFGEYAHGSSDSEAISVMSVDMPFGIPPFRVVSAR